MYVVLSGVWKAGVVLIVGFPSEVSCLKGVPVVFVVGVAKAGLSTAYRVQAVPHHTELTEVWKLRCP